MVGSTVEFVLVSAVAGLVAAIGMGYPMWKQSDGFAPAYVAVGLLTRRNFSDVPLQEALVLHHVAGTIAGVLYAVLALSFGGGVPAVVTVAGVPLAPHLLATLVVVAGIYGVFAKLILPRASAGRYEETDTAVRGQWLRSALAFGAAMVVLVPAILSAVV